MNIKSWTRAEFVTLMNELLKNQTSMTPRDDSLITDLGLDSLDHLELSSELEDALETEFNEEELVINFHNLTVKDCIDNLIKSLCENGYLLIDDVLDHSDD